MGKFTDLAFKALLGDSGGLTWRELFKSIERNSFADYLPWVGYVEKSKVYINIDDTAGFAWECSPLAFAGEASAKTLEGLFRLGLPAGSVMQFILCADDHIDGYINSFRQNKEARNHPLVKGIAKEFGDYFRRGTQGMQSLSGIPVRNFRLFVTLKVPADSKEFAKLNLGELRGSAMEVLNGARLYPRELTGAGLVDFMRRLFNFEPSSNNGHYDKNVPLRKQLIFSQTEIKKSSSRITFGGRIFRCVTPKTIPDEVDLFQTNQLVGGVWGLISDSDQIRTPFIFTMNVVFEDLKAKLHTKCNLALQQKAVGSFAPSLQRKQEEYLWATDHLEKGTKFLRIVPALWVYGDDETAVNDSVTRAKRIWESQGYVMQEDRGILPVVFILSLPFGLYNKKGFLDNLDRDFIAPAQSVALTLPVQADFSGGGDPVLMLLGRKGQVVSLDVFARGSNNHNIFIAATSGSGKSFFVNYLASNYFGSGAKIRIIDIGGSYKKMTRMFDAVYMDFKPRMSVCLNPLSNVVDPDLDLPMAAVIIAQMANASDPEATPTRTEMTILEQAVKHAHTTKGPDANIDTVFEYLDNHKEHAKAQGLVYTNEIGRVAKELAFNIEKFTTRGPYGKYFNAKASLDIAHDDFVVLELEHLSQIPALFNVVTLQVVNLVTQNLYLSDRSRPIFIIFDEAHQFLRKGGIIGEAIDAGYRRARKYGGSFSIITQSMLDLKKFGDVGEVIWGNSAYRFLLESVDYEKARSEKLIDYDDFTMKILKSVRSNPPKYSEVFMDTPFGVGVGRLIVDRFSYYAYTSRAEEIAEIESLVKKGMAYDEAIRVMIKRHG